MDPRTDSEQRRSQKTDLAVRVLRVMRSAISRSCCMSAQATAPIDIGSGSTSKPTERVGGNAGDRLGQAIRRSPAVPNRFGTGPNLLPGQPGSTDARAEGGME